MKSRVAITVVAATVAAAVVGAALLCGLPALSVAPTGRTPKEFSASDPGPQRPLSKPTAELHVEAEGERNVKPAPPERCCIADADGEVVGPCFSGPPGGRVRRWVEGHGVTEWMDDGVGCFVTEIPAIRLDIRSAGRPSALIGCGRAAPTEPDGYVELWATHCEVVVWWAGPPMVRSEPVTVDADFGATIVVDEWSLATAPPTEDEELQFRIASSHLLSGLSGLDEWTDTLD